ncbi:MAG: tetratricopeptide repeat-containing sulfotransferase family protein [bacterium]
MTKHAKTNRKIKSAQVLSRFFVSRKFLAIREEFNRLDKKSKKNPEVLRLYALAELNLGFIDKSEKILLRLIKNHPTNKVVYANLGSLYGMKNNFEYSLKYFKKAISLDQKFEAAWFNMAKLYKRYAYLDDALLAFDKALEIKPERVEACVMMGDVYKAKGNIDGSIKCYLNAIELDGSNANAWWQLANLKTYKFTDEQRKVLNQLVGAINKGLDSALIHLSLSRAEEQAQSYDASFDHLKKANDIIASARPYNAAYYDDFLSKLKNTFSMVSVSKKSRNSSSTANIFVVGMFRSGTTLAHQILSSHDQVFGVGELMLLEQMYKEARLDRSDCEWVNDYKENIAEKFTPSTVYVDKYPLNFMYVGWILECFPDAKIIHCTRDAMDCCLSNYQQFFANGAEFSFNQESLAHFYNFYIKTMHFWKKKYPGQILNFPMEELIASQEEKTREMLSFCDLPWDDKCMQFETFGGDARTASASQVRTKLNKRGVAKWKKFEKQWMLFKKSLDDFEASY